MRSSPPAKALKLQLAVEQPLTRECWNPPKKDTPHPKTKKKPQQDSRRGTIMIKSNPIPAGWVTTDLRTIIPKKFLHYCEGSEPHIRLPSLAIRERDWESPGNLAVRASGI